MPVFDQKAALDALSAPLGDVIASVGRGVAEAQLQMDSASLGLLREVYSSNEQFYQELKLIGYRPTNYCLQEVDAKLQIAITISENEQTTPATAGGTKTGASRIKLRAAPVDAGYSSQYNFSLQAASQISFKIVPVPPSTTAETLQVVPLVTKLTLDEAHAVLSRFGIAFEDVAEDREGEQPLTTVIVKGQDPVGGSFLPSGGVVKLTYGPK